MFDLHFDFEHLTSNTSTATSRTELFNDLFNMLTEHANETKTSVYQALVAYQVQRLDIGKPAVPNLFIKFTDLRLKVREKSEQVSKLIDELFRIPDVCRYEELEYKKLRKQLITLVQGSLMAEAVAHDQALQRCQK